MNDRQRMTVVAVGLGAVVLVAALVVLLPEPTVVVDETASEVEEQTSRGGGLAADDVVYSYGDRPVRATRSTPRGRGRQMVDTNGKLLMDQLTVAVRNDDGTLSYVPGDDPRAVALLAEPHVETEEEKQLKQGTEQITSPVPSDNNSAMTARLTLP